MRQLDFGYGIKTPKNMHRANPVPLSFSPVLVLLHARTNHRPLQVSVGGALIIIHFLVHRKIMKTRKIHNILGFYFSLSFSRKCFFFLGCRIIFRFHRASLPKGKLNFGSFIEDLLGGY